MSKADSTANRLTVLTTFGGIKAVKTYSLDDKGKIVVEGYGRAKTYTHREIEVDERGEWLRALGPESQSFVVLGEVIDKSRRKIRRLSSARDGDEATLRDVPRSWMPLDIDQFDVPLDTLYAPDDGKRIAKEVMRRLGIAGAWCVWHFTNSHGFNGRYRIRLWIMLAEPATCEQMKAYARERWGGDEFRVDALDKNGRSVRKPIVDPAVFQPQQPIYTGDPILRGVSAPVSNRVGFIKGRPLELRVAVSKRKRSDESPDENIRRLKAAGLYIGRLRPGQHMIRCPWEDEHSGDERDDDTFYFEPHYNGHGEPRFVCHHATHKDAKWWEHVIEWMDERSQREADDAESPGYVYVARAERFWDARDGALVTPSAYAARAGCKRDEAVTRFRKKGGRIVDDARFEPGRPRFFEESGLELLNTYIDQRVKPDPSIDASPWVEHLAWVIPDERDRERLCDWLAWVYQRPGEKITWAPILYGPPGTGKTTIFNCLAECVGRNHVSEPTQAELEDKFNDWCYGKLLVKIEELMSGDKFHVAEKLKPVVANPTVSVRRMHQTGFTIRNTANVCASTNHMQALPIERGDRRYMLIQCVEADEGERRPRLRAFHEWLSKVGYGGIAHWLATRDVSAFVPTSEAPITRLKQVVAEASKTDFERAVDLCDVFDGYEIVTSSVVSEYLLRNDCKLSASRLGLIAQRRKWTALPNKEGRCFIEGWKVTTWSPVGDKQAIREFVRARPEERKRRHEALSARLSFDPVARPKLIVHKGGKSDE